MVEQTIAGPSVAAHGAVGNKYVVRGAIDIVRLRTHGKSRHHGASTGGPAHDVKSQARLHQRLVETDMGRAIGAATAGNKAKGGAVDEAIKPLRVAHVVERHV